MLHMLPFVLLSSSSVVGGTPVQPGHWRDAVAVLSATTACTGTLITPDVVLTAGHCIDPEPIYVVVGTVDYGKPGGEAIRVQASLAYPRWEETFDVGLVILDHPATIAPRPVASACAIRDGLVEGARVKLVGFGLTTMSGTGDNTRLHEGTLSILDASCDDPGACATAVWPGGEFIAGGDRVDACFGDSGGPVYLDTPAGAALVGVVSRGLAMADPPCGSGGVYVRADQVVPWIERVTHQTVPRTSCRRDGDPLSEGEAGEPPSGGCSAGGGPGNTMLIGLGVLIAAGAYRRRPPGAIRLAAIGIIRAR